MDAIVDPVQLRVLGQAVVAIVLGGLVGWERESAGKWAGFRTHMLVCLASMMFTSVGHFIVESPRFSDGDSPIRLDPIRVLEAIVGGVAFLGAGTIFRDKSSRNLEGLTTAASLLSVAPIGVAVAIGQYVFAVGATVLVLIVLRVVRKVEASVSGDKE